MISTLQAERIRDAENKLRAWLGKRTSYTLDEVPADIPRITNEDRADLELYNWHTDAPDKYFAYYVQCAQRGTDITNWTGRKLGTVTDAGLVWRSNMGDRRRAIRVMGTNGVEYTGTAYLDSGNYCRLRRVKSRA